MKNLILLSAVVLLSTNFAFAQSTQSTEAILNLTGTVAQQLAIDIDIAAADTAGSCISEHECAQNLGNLLEPLQKEVAKIGILARSAYQVKMFSDNGNLKGEAGTPSADYSLEYKLGWESANALQDVPVQASAAPMIAFTQDGFECSLISGCPDETPNKPRHSIVLDHSGDPTLGAGAYSDKVHFQVEDASGI